jgi:hypothetical protein
MGNVELAECQPVADICPRDVTNELKGQAFPACEAELGGCDQHRGIDQRDEPGPYGLRIPACDAGTTGQSGAGLVDRSHQVHSGSSTSRSASPQP